VNYCRADGESGMGEILEQLLCAEAAREDRRQVRPRLFLPADVRRKFEPPERAASGLFGVASGASLAASLPRLVAEVARETTIAAVVARIASAFVKRLGARTARVYLTGESEDGPTLRLGAAQNIDVAIRARLRTVGIDDALPAAVAARSGQVQLLDASDAATFGHSGGSGEGVVFALPLFSSGAVVGAVSAAFGELARKDCAALLSLSDSLGALLDPARLREEVARLGRTRATAREAVKDWSRGAFSQRHVAITAL
jgi:hypothetical protein